MHDGADSVAVSSEGVAWEVTGEVGEAYGAVTGVAGAVIGQARAGAMTIGEDKSSAVTAVLAQSVREPPPWM